MRFWELLHPEYESDYQFTHINGILDHPFGMPGVQCDICGETWGGGHILPIECPNSLRSHKQIKEGWPIPIEQFIVLRQKIEEQLVKIDISSPVLEPGDSFQPAYLDIPSRPMADFLWASGKSLVVSKRVKDLFESLRVSRVACCPIVLRKIGKRQATLPAPIPTTGEPEDIIADVPLLEQAKSVGPYFELVVEAESGYAPGTEPLSTCLRCGRETFPKNVARDVMIESMWNGTDIFFLASSYITVVTDKLKGELEKIGATNVDFKEFGVLTGRS